MEEVSLNSQPPSNAEVEEYGDLGGECAMTEYVNQTGNVLQGHNPLPPAVGMEFESYDDVYFFYSCYAKQQGFGVRVSNTWYRKNKERYRGKLSCSSAGFKKKTEANRPRPQTRTGCPAMIKFKLMENDRWRIIEAELEHNHLTGTVSASSCKSRRIITDLGCKRPLSDGEGNQIRLFRTVVMDAEDNSGILKINEGTHGDNKLKLKNGDAQEMLDFFTRMQLSSPSFFYVIDVNEKGCLRNVFWAEGKCRAAYSYFGDVLFIDTKALMENYEVPLVIFTGVNQHGQCFPLGCGLVSGSVVESFIWLFRAWLTYMVGRSPPTIITSWCEFFEAAIAEVFPRAFHCLDLKYTMNKVLNELAGSGDFDAIRKTFTRAVYHSSRVDEFEKAWEKMVQSHGLSNLEWVQSLYGDRKRWAPVYLKEVFFAGMFHTKEDERLTSPFEEHLSQHTSLKEFLQIYDRVTMEIDQRERTSNIESRKSCHVLKSRFYFELQLSRLYTKNMFEKFQDEIEGMQSCLTVRRINVDGSVVTYIVKENTGAEENRRDFEVVYNTSYAEVVCACALFNFKGYLCRHALSVINQIGLEEIPPQYVLDRWRKDVERNYAFSYGSHGIDVNNHAHRYEDLYKRVVKVLEQGTISRDRYKFALESLDGILNRVRIREVEQLP